MAFYYRKDYFEKHEEKYDYYSEEDLNAIQSRVPFSKENGRLLDLACGSGIVGEFFSSQLPQFTVVGVDLCLPLLNWVDYHKCLSDATFLPFRDQSFDSILAVAAFHHFPDVNRAIGECFRCLKPEGIFLSVEPNKFHPQRLVMMTNPLRNIFYKSGDHAISPLSFKRKLINHGFDEIKMGYMAFKGKRASRLSGLNHALTNRISKTIFSGFLPFCSPWFIVTAKKGR